MISNNQLECAVEPNGKSKGKMNFIRLLLCTYILIIMQYTVHTISDISYIKNGHAVCTAHSRSFVGCFSFFVCVHNMVASQTNNSLNAWRASIMRLQKSFVFIYFFFKNDIFRQSLFKIKSNPPKLNASRKNPGIYWSCIPSRTFA